MSCNLKYHKNTMLFVWINVTKHYSSRCFFSFPHQWSFCSSDSECLLETMKHWMDRVRQQAIQHLSPLFTTWTGLWAHILIAHYRESIVGNTHHMQKKPWAFLHCRILSVSEQYQYLGQLPISEALFLSWHTRKLSFSKLLFFDRFKALTWMCYCQLHKYLSEFISLCLLLTMKV